MDIETKDKKRSSPRFNAFDLVIILVLLFAIVTPIFFAVRNDSSGERKNIVYTLRLDNVSAESIKKITKGQDVVDVKTGKVIGSVRGIDDSVLYKVYERSEDGKIVSADNKNKDSYVVLTVMASAVYNNVEGYTVQQERITVGKEFTVRLPSVETTAICTDLHQ